MDLFPIFCAAFISVSTAFALPDSPISATQIPAGVSQSDWSGIREAYENTRHGILSKPDGTHHTRNPGQAWGTRFDARGFDVTPDQGGWSWGLELKSYGYTGHMLPSEAAAATSAGNRLEYRRGGNLTEWFINDSRGLEQGWTLSHRPEGAENGAPLKLELAVRGQLAATIGNDGSSVSFVHPGTSNTAISYSSLKAWDADGKSVPVKFAPSADGNGGFQVVADDTAARYPITIDPLAQQGYLKASNAENSDRFGYAVALSGNTAVVSAPYEASSATGINGDQTDNSAKTSGAVYVFVRNGGSWSQQAYIKASNTGTDDQFGYTVAIDGNTIVVGAPNEDSNAKGVNGDQSNNSGSNTGAAYVFVRNGTTWSQQAYLKTSETSFPIAFGNAVAVSGNTVVIGAYKESGNGYPIGAAYIFVRDGDSWSKQALLLASNPGLRDYFATSVALSGDTLVVGAPDEGSDSNGVNGVQADESATAAGAAYVFVRSGTTWSQQAYLKASNSDASDRFGYSVAISANTVVVGAYGEASGALVINGDQADNAISNAGAAYVFFRAGSTWTQQAYLKASNSGSTSDYFGVSVAVSGDSIVVGASGEDSSATGVNGNQNNDAMPGSGAAYLFSRSGSTWSQQAYLKAPNYGGDFGDSVAISGDTALVGATSERSRATGVNGNPFDLPTGPPISNTGPGAAFIFQSTYSLSASAAHGSIGGTGNFFPGLTATATATADSGYVFDGWTGDASGKTNPLQIVMSANKTIAATMIPDTADADGDGLDNYTEIIVRGTNPTVPDTDGDTYSDGYEVQFSTDPKSNASFPTFKLVLANGGSAEGGAFNKSGTLAHGTNANLTALPSPGYLFGQWTGDGSGTTNPLTLLMNGDKTVGAAFVHDTADPDGDGLDNYAEIIVNGTEPEVADTDGDGYSDGYEVRFSTDPKSDGSVPTFTLELVNGGSSLGGSFSKSGSLAHGTDAIVTAVPSPGYLFQEWTGDAKGTASPVAVLMDSDKTVGAGFMQDPSDPDNDGLTTYQEIIVLGTNPNKADSDNDGVRDNTELADKTNPISFDTDNDGLGDGVEKKLGTNPLRKDSDKNGIADADEDNDKDGIPNGREANDLRTNPNRVDSDGDGLIDTFALAFTGKTAFLPRIGDDVKFDFGKLEWGGTLRLVGTLPPGLTFNAETRILKGTLVGQPGLYKLQLQFFDGRSYVRSVPLPLRIAPFPSGLAGSYEGLLVNPAGRPAGLLRVAVIKPGNGPDARATFSASLDVAGSSTVREITGTVSLDPAADSTRLGLRFPADGNLESVDSGVTVASDSSLLIDGAYTFDQDQDTLATIKGFRIANKAPDQKNDRPFTMVIDQGEVDGFTIPAGLGWATGSLDRSGDISMTGRLGDARRFETSARLSVTGQAIVWVKPYRNLHSCLGGIISIGSNDAIAPAAAAGLTPGLVWVRERDTTELSYPDGFGPVHAQAGLSFFNPPATAAALATRLGLANNTFKPVLIEGAGLPDTKGAVALPKALVLGNKFNLSAMPNTVPWTGSIDPASGRIDGTLQVPKAGFGIIAGSAQASGVLIPGVGFEGIVGAGLVKIPVNDAKGAFRTAALVLSK